MKLYAFQPKGHGEKSFFVLAESEEEARIAVRKKIAELVNEDFGYMQAYADSFDTDYYKVTVVKAGVVVTNENS